MDENRKKTLDAIIYHFDLFLKEQNKPDSEMVHKYSDGYSTLEVPISLLEVVREELKEYAESFKENQREKERYATTKLVTFLTWFLAHETPKISTEEIETWFETHQGG
ncbi:hypothetical protein [Lactococcus allomyrinae]|uniref:Uncharacterized protein n=1 Tax=Lactococcus allomyrinae TaxID=2419773 RepID=A0A387BMT6_9LACT|nr:hypothetical protein [Lactococcus allomyrinae]AYF99840.1 hypothetical protein D7I46_01325 [Lactococcus allomyrinae]